MARFHCRVRYGSARKGAQHRVYGVYIGRRGQGRGAEMSQFERGLLAVMGPLAALASQPQRIPPALPDEEEAALFRVRSFAMRRLSVARLRCEVHQLVLEAEMEELGRE
ncbi:unnamed protein product [Boreogadus saida]